MPKAIDATGQKYNRLTALTYLGYSKSGGRVWRCLCDCGNYINVPIGYLRNGNTKSCGCLLGDRTRKRNRQNSTIKIGDKYGKLTVIGDAGLKPASGGKNRHWSICQCECGNIVEKMDNSFQSGGTQSCGCLISRGENIISKILDENHIVYGHNQSFEELTKETGRPLRFDFVIYQNGTIDRFVEFDGNQHRQGWDGGNWSNSENNKKIRERDEIKNNFCLSKGYILIRIPYHKIDTLTLEDIISNKYQIRKDDKI